MIAKRLSAIYATLYICCHQLFSIAIVPSAPPENVITTEVSTTSVHLNWIPPPTKHHNGVITGYVARVTMANTQESYNILTSNTRELLVDSLTPDSEYIFAVAAQTVIGIGPFSGTITQQTKPSKYNFFDTSPDPSLCKLVQQLNF